MTVKILVVLGATGEQGGGVVDALVSSGSIQQYDSVRCVTRDPNSSKAKALAKKSSKLVPTACDIRHRDQVKEAFKGAWGVFAVTNFWDPNIGTKEYDIGCMLADVAKEANVSVFVWSTLPNAEKRTNGKFFVDHFTLKARVDEHIQRIGLPAVFVQPSVYFSNIRSFFKVVKDPSKPDRYTCTLPLDPTVKLPFFDPNDTGLVVNAIFESPDKYVGKYIPLVGEVCTYPQCMREMGEALGKQIDYVHAKYEDMAYYGKEVLDMLRYYDEFNLYPSDADLNLARKIAPNMKDAKQWVRSSGFKLD